MSEPSLLDKRRIRRNFARAALRYDHAAALSREVARRMLERLDLVRLLPERILDAGAGSGLATYPIARRYPRARTLALDASLPMLRQMQRRASWRQLLQARIGAARIVPICADFEQLPIAGASIDLVVSNLALHWSVDVGRAIGELHRVLRPGGLLMFTTLGPDTLKELAHASAAGAGGCRVHRFVDMHDLGDLLAHSGFAGPVMDMEYLTLTYAGVDELLRELRDAGGVSAQTGRTGLRTPRWKARLAARYEALRVDGRLPATFEIVYGHAWKSERAPRAPDRPSIIRWDMPARGR